MKDTQLSRLKVLFVASIVLFSIAFVSFVISIMINFTGTLSEKQLSNLIIMIVSVIPATAFSVMYFSCKEKEKEKKDKGEQ